MPYYPNALFRYYLEAVEKICTRAVAVQILTDHAGLPQYADNAPPPNMQTDVPYKDVAALIMGMERYYGQRDGRGIAIRAARQMMQRGDLFVYGGIDTEPAASQKIQRFLPRAAQLVHYPSDPQTVVQELDTAYQLTIEVCPFCYGRGADSILPDGLTPCHPVKGILQEGLYRVTGGFTFEVTQPTCRAAGAPHCTFHIGKQPTETPGDLNTRKLN